MKFYSIIFFGRAGYADERRDIMAASDDDAVEQAHARLVAHPINDTRWSGFELHCDGRLVDVFREEISITLG
jgi:hypothetical protein